MMPFSSYVNKLNFSLRGYEAGNPNRDVLEAATAIGWRKAFKTKGLWARKLDAPLRFKTLEAWETAKAGDWLCIGDASDKWPQSEKALLGKYDRLDGNTKRLGGKAFARFEPKASQPPVIAVQMPKPFRVIATWGDLKGNANDYVVMNAKDEHNRNPADVWIVAKRLFDNTYQWA